MPADEPRRPRLIFLVVGLVLATALGVGLFTSFGTGSGGGGAGTRPTVGSPAPTFELARLGGGQVTDPPTGVDGRHPVVLLFFGNWCPECHSELPALAAAVHRQQRAGGVLADVTVLGVDSYDDTAAARSFARASKVTFPVGLDPAADVLNGLYYFTGDPEAVFIDAADRIRVIRYGPISAGLFQQLERSLLIPSGR